jgi:hypothetical protein
MRKVLSLPAMCPVFSNRDADARAIVSLLLSYGLARGYLFSVSGGYVTTSAQIDRWLAVPQSQRIHDFALYTHEISGEWRLSLLPTSTTENTCVWISPNLFNDADQSHVRKSLLLLWYSEQLAVRQESDSLLFCACVQPVVKKDDEASTAPIILPDFSALVSPEAGESALAEFSFIGTLDSLDQVYRGMIDRNAVNDALAAGIKAERLLETLTRWRAPANVCETVREWIREFSRLYLAHDNIIVSFDEKTSRSLSSFGPITEIIEPISAHAVFSIRKGHEHRAEELLRSMGYDPRVPGTMVLSQEPDENMQAVPTGISPCFDFDPAQSDSTDSGIKSGKYSSELKPLDVNEMCHVIEYAILMGNGIKIDYEGSPGIKRGLHQFIPASVKRGQDPEVTVISQDTGRTKSFKLKRITKMGVDSHVGTDD